MPHGRENRLAPRRPTVKEGAAHRLLESTAALRALLAPHLPRAGATPLLLAACLASGKLAQALLQLLAHRGMAEMARHEALMEQVGAQLHRRSLHRMLRPCVDVFRQRRPLCQLAPLWISDPPAPPFSTATQALGLVSLLAATPDLRPMLLQASRLSNEHLSLSQVGSGLATAPSQGGRGRARLPARAVVKPHSRLRGYRLYHSLPARSAARHGNSLGNHVHSSRPRCELYQRCLSAPALCWHRC